MELYWLDVQNPAQPPDVREVMERSLPLDHDVLRSLNPMDIYETIRTITTFEEFDGDPALLLREFDQLVQLALMRGGSLEVRAGFHAVLELLGYCDSYHDLVSNVKLVREALAARSDTPRAASRAGTPVEDVDGLYYMHTRRLVYVRWANPLLPPNMYDMLTHCMDVRDLEEDAPFRCYGCGEKLIAGYQAVDGRGKRDTRQYRPGRRTGLDVCVSCAVVHLNQRWRSLEYLIAIHRGLESYLDIAVVPAALNLGLEVSVEKALVQGGGLHNQMREPLELTVCIRGPDGFYVAMCVTPSFLFDAQVENDPHVDDMFEHANLALPLGWYPREVPGDHPTFPSCLKFVELCADDSQPLDPAEDGTCCICLESLLSSGSKLPVRTKCGHSYHNECLEAFCTTSEAAGRSPTCAVCRKEYPLEQVTRHAKPVTEEFRMLRDSLDEPLQANRGYIVVALLYRHRHHPIDSAIQVVALSYRHSVDGH
eukprot:TRINITY_DN3050_c0_g1_i3.p1 TRINITY_DN3050_c0_g1~~TRINITY_DN3050_c0_g1_i3.p1  ORF type:complete len:481 (+),score=44.49 TRINITY_DN3050_c0_g1_i3:137-1579(+)